MRYIWGFHIEPLIIFQLMDDQYFHINALAFPVERPKGFRGMEQRDRSNVRCDPRESINLLNRLVAHIVN